MNCVISDPNIRVACLSCFGAMLTVQAPLLEVTYILQASKTTTTRQSNVSASDADVMQPEAGVTSAMTSGDSSYLSSAVSAGLDTSMERVFSTSRTPTSDAPSPQVSSGSLTPSQPDVTESLQHVGSASWLIRMCVKNVAPQLLEKSGSMEDKTR